MALSNTLTPFMAAVTATTSATDIYTLLVVQRTKLPHKCCYLSIQVDSAEGGDILYVGNSDVSSTNYGVALFASQAAQEYAFDSNLLVLDHIYLLASAATMVIGLTVVVR